MVNRLILGDNLEILKTMESETIDLVCLDPPFFSNRNYEVLCYESNSFSIFNETESGHFQFSIFNFQLNRVRYALIHSPKMPVRQKKSGVFFPIL
jgi:DNA modification methylase